MTPIPSSRVAKAHHGSNMWIVALAVLAGLAPSVPAEAATYQFAVPSTLIQSALTIGISPTDPQLYAFYDFYIRPTLPGESILQAVAGNANGQILSSSTIVGFAPPIPSGPDAYTASLFNGAAPPDGTNPNARYTFASGDTIEALITPNLLVAGHSYEPGLTAEVMPGSANFYITISSASPLLTGVVRFDVRAVAYQFGDASSPVTPTDKSAGFTGFFDLQVPEPGALFTVSAGLALLALVRARRHRRMRANS